MERIWTLSTVLSFSRIVLIAPVAYCLLNEFPNNRLWAGAFFLAGVATDFLDGYLARRLHQVTDFGKIIDPVADKIAVAGVAIVLFLMESVPLWYLVLMILRDVLIFVGGVYIKRTKNIVAQSNLPGKVAVNLIALFLILSFTNIESLETFRLFVLWSSVAMMLFSLVVYAQRLFIGRNIVSVNG
ncbi:MAG: CDP-alcohol phosphatidyltransferase family protein [Ignavibacteriales bacterium]|nr:CDP-alcohol phosphatidyltransferase family protein [Ignavibacteriales bacterium]